jgi:hypothetical protein
MGEFKKIPDVAALIRATLAASNLAKATLTNRNRRLPQRLKFVAPIVHPGRRLKRELAARKLSANRLSLDIGMPSGRITDILNTRRAITADCGAARPLFRK